MRLLRLDRLLLFPGVLYRGSSLAFEAAVRCSASLRAWTTAAASSGENSVLGFRAMVTVVNGTSLILPATLLLSYAGIMADRVARILAAMRANPSNVRFDDLLLVCTTFFGEYRLNGTSHYVFKMPWPGDPRVNIQDAHGKAKP